LNNNISNPNSEIFRSIQYQGKSPNGVMQELQGLAGIYADTSQKNDYSSTISNWKTNEDLGIRGPGESMFTLKEASNISRFDENLSEALEKIRTGQDVERIEYTKDGTGMAMSGQGSIKNVKAPASYENVLSGPQQKQYDEIVEILIENENPEALIAAKNSPEMAREVQAYLKNAGNLLKQNAVIQDDFVKYYGTSVGANSKSRKEIDDHTRTNFKDLRYGYDGKEYAWNELPSDVRTKFLNKQSSNYQGYMSPKNFEGLHKEGDSELYVSPHVYNLVGDDGKAEDLYVGRSSGERSTPAFAADRDYNKIYRAKYRPNKTYTLPQIGISYKYNAQSQKYIVTNIKTGEKTSMDDTQLQDSLYDMYGAN
jgi:hypothetical protein